jgi:hypothetical protein
MFDCACSDTDESSVLANSAAAQHVRVGDIDGRAEDEVPPIGCARRELYLSTIILNSPCIGHGAASIAPAPSAFHWSFANSVERAIDRR